MLNYKKYLLLSWFFFASTISSAFGTYLPLPKSVQSKAVYHVKAYQLDKWSCGYNALFNACNIEQYLTKSNKFSNYPLFNHFCSAYLKSKKMDPSKASNNRTLEELAKHLKLQKFQYLVEDKAKGVHPLISGVRISYPAGLPKAKIAIKLQEAKNKKEQEKIKEIKDYLKKNKGKICCAHFVCHIVALGGPHGILITLVQNKQGDRALYVYDNMNLSIHENSLTKKYINYLCKEFNVSKANKFADFKLPNRWSSY